MLDLKCIWVEFHVVDNCNAYPEWEITTSSVKAAGNQPDLNKNEKESA